MTKPTHRLSKWYRQEIAEHDKALARPMPPKTRYVGETHERKYFKKRYDEMIKAQRKRTKRTKRRTP